MCWGNDGGRLKVVFTYISLRAKAVLKGKKQRLIQKRIKEDSRDGLGLSKAYMFGEVTASSLFDR